MGKSPAGFGAGEDDRLAIVSCGNESGFRGECEVNKGKRRETKDEKGSGRSAWA